MAQKEKPAKTCRVGKIKAVVWKNRTRENEVRHNTEFIRSYLQDGQWKDATTFSPLDLLQVIKAAQLAFDWIHHQEESPQEADSDTDSIE